MKQPKLKLKQKEKAPRQTLLIVEGAPMEIRVNLEKHFEYEWEYDQSISCKDCLYTDCGCDEPFEVRKRTYIGREYRLLTSIPNVKYQEWFSTKEELIRYLSNAIFKTVLPNQNTLF